MKRILFIVAVFVGLIGWAPHATAQNPVQFQITTQDVTGQTCNSDQGFLRVPQGTLYTCQSGVEKPIGGSGGSCAALGGDTTGPCDANTTSKLNNAVIPLSAAALASNGARQLIAATAGAQVLSVSFPASDLVCAHAGDTTISGFTCSNTITDATGTPVYFATTYTYPMNYWAANKILLFIAQISYWSPSGILPTNAIGFDAASTHLYTQTANTSPAAASRTNAGSLVAWMVSAADTGANIFTEMLIQPNDYLTLSNSLSNSVVQPVNLGVNSFALRMSSIWSATGVASGTYTSGITATGSIGQTCLLTFTGGGGSFGTATVALTGTNAIAGGTTLVITNTGRGFTSGPIAATVANGTATCTGAAVVATTLGGAQGNALRLQSLTILQLSLI